MEEESEQEHKNVENVEEEFTTVEEAAHCMRVHTDTLRGYVKKGFLDAIQPFGPHGSLRIRIRSIQDLVAKHTVNKVKKKGEESEHDE